MMTSSFNLPNSNSPDFIETGKFRIRRLDHGKFNLELRDDLLYIDDQYLVKKDIKVLHSLLEEALSYWVDKKERGK